MHPHKPHATSQPSLLTRAQTHHGLFSGFHIMMSWPELSPTTNKLGLFEAYERWFSLLVSGSVLSCPRDVS